MVRYEYSVHTISGSWDREIASNFFEEKGSTGWELVAVVVLNAPYERLYFKRRID